MGILNVRLEPFSSPQAGDASLLGAGHDAWVIGDDPVVVVDFQGMVDYAKGAVKT